MTSETDMRRAKVLGRVAAIFVGALGVATLGAVVIATISPTVWLTIHEDIVPVIFAIAVAISVGSHCLLLARQAWSGLSKDVIRRMLLTAGALIALALMVFTGGFWILVHGWEWVIFLLPVLATLLLFLSYSRLFVRWFLPDVAVWGQRKKPARSFYLLLAWVVWLSCCLIIASLAPTQPARAYAPGESSLWIWLALLGPLVPAYLIYKLGMHVALRKSHADYQNKSTPNC